MNGQAVDKIVRVESAWGVHPPQVIGLHLHSTAVGIVCVTRLLAIEKSKKDGYISAPSPHSRRS
eukprot:6190588-Pleurochrysis_carterae.AAC.2